MNLSFTMWQLGKPYSSLCLLKKISGSNCAYLVSDGKCLLILLKNFYIWWVTSCCFQVLSLYFGSLIIVCLGIYRFEFVFLVVCQAFWMYRFMPIIKFGKCLAIISLNILSNLFLCLLLWLPWCVYWWLSPSFFRLLIFLESFFSKCIILISYL